MRVDKFKSKALQPTRGADFEVDYAVFLPKGYTPEKHYGAVYYLHWLDKDMEKATHEILFDVFNVCQYLDDLVDQGGNPYLIVAPKGRNSFWVNGAETQERWSDMLADDLVDEVERKYSLISQPEARIVAGHSMGAYGALMNGLTRSDVFAHVASHSPVIRSNKFENKRWQVDAKVAPMLGQDMDYNLRDPTWLLTEGGFRFKGSLYLDVGADDWFYPTIEDCVQILQGANYPGELHIKETPGDHTPPYWKGMFSKYLQWYSETLPAPVL